MLRGMYTAAAGMISEQRKHDTITNNIANLNTTGYKQINAISRSFPEVLLSLQSGDKGMNTVRTIGKLNTGVLAEEAPSLYVQGDLIETGKTFDFAIASAIQEDGLTFGASGLAIGEDGTRIAQKQLFFTLQDAEGNRKYTRDGSFTINDAGELATSAGYQVVGLNGQPIRLTNSTGAAIANAAITNEGRFIDPLTGQPLLDAGGRPAGMLLSRVDNPNRLIREGTGVYHVNEGEEALIVALVDGQNGANDELTAWVASNEASVHQGQLERSNVDVAAASIDLNAALRAYEANQKVIQYYDRSLDKAVNEVGRV